MKNVTSVTRGTCGRDYPTTVLVNLLLIARVLISLDDCYTSRVEIQNTEYRNTEYIRKETFIKKFFPTSSSTKSDQKWKYAETVPGE